MTGTLSLSHTSEYIDARPHENPYLYTWHGYPAVPARQRVCVCVTDTLRQNDQGKVCVCVCATRQLTEETVPAG